MLWLLVLSFTALVRAAPMQSVVYEAESAALTGGPVVASNHPGYTGTGFAAGFTSANRGAAQAAFQVNAPTAGAYEAALRYANGTGAARTLSLYVNGAKVRQTNLAATANWGTWATQAEPVTLVAGSNTIAYKYDTTDSGNVNLDKLTLTGSAGVNLQSEKPSPLMAATTAPATVQRTSTTTTRRLTGKVFPMPTPTASR